MKYLIGVDVGSTFTDVVCASGNRLESVKVETTPHDLTVCFMDGIKKCASTFDSVEKVLSQSEPVRWSSTVATNIIAMKTGSPLGLIVTKGTKELLNKNFDLTPFVNSNLFAELDEEVNQYGEVVKGIKREELIETVEGLLDKGARVLAISLKNSSVNPVNEKRVKEILYQEYPEYYLGCTETILGSEVTPRRDYAKRTITALLDAYIHKGLVKFLYKGDDELIKAGSHYPMFIVQASGGMARAAKTVAINTIGAGPTASLSSTSLMAKLYDKEPLIVFEVGGATSNCSIGKKGGGTYRSDALIENLPVYIYSPDVTSIGLGGGTIIRLKDNVLEVGPESAGSLPGPACFDLGNDEPTMCDVNLVLGYIDSDYFEGGARKLLKELAIEALQPLAKALGVTVEKLCVMVREITREKHVQLVKSKAEQYGIKPEECTMIVCGGEGPIHACAVADLLDVETIIISKNSAIFGAVGCVLMDVVSMYESYSPVVLRDEKGNYLSDYNVFNVTANKLRHNINLDMKAQGFKEEEVTYVLELEVEDVTGSFRSTIPHSKLQIAGEEDIKTISQTYLNEYARVNGSDKICSGIIKADIIRMKGIKSTPAWQPAICKEEALKSTEIAFKGSRKVFWQNQYEETSVYQGELLQFSHVINGPAIIEEKYTTVAVPKGWKVSVDKYLNKILEKL